MGTLESLNKSFFILPEPGILFGDETKDLALPQWRPLEDERHLDRNTNADSQLGSSCHQHCYFNSE